MKQQASGQGHTPLRVTKWVQGQTGQGTPHDDIPVYPPAFSEPKEVLEKPPANGQRKSSVSGEGHPVILLRSQKVGGHSSHSPPAHMSKARASMSSPLTPGSRGRTGILLGKLPRQFHPTPSVFPDQAHSMVMATGCSPSGSFQTSTHIHANSVPYSDGCGPLKAAELLPGI